MTFNSLLSIFLNLAAIVACGAIGAVAAYGLLTLFDAPGVFGALGAAVVGMFVATIAWAAGSAALRAAGLIR